MGQPGFNSNTTRLFRFSSRAHVLPTFIPPRSHKNIFNIILICFSQALFARTRAFSPRHRESFQLERVLFFIVQLSTHAYPVRDRCWEAFFFVFSKEQKTHAKSNEREYLLQKRRFMDSAYSCSPRWRVSPEIIGFDTFGKRALVPVSPEYPGEKFRPLSG